MKKMIALLLAVVMLMGVASMTVSAAFGDVNADGDTNVRDIAVIQQYVAGWSVTIDPVGADMNGDGDVNVRDIAILQQYVAGWEIVPKITLPAVGTDIDVTKKKDRIRVSAASAVYASDGTLTVSLTFKNHTTKWITEETDWVEYTCYDANNNVTQKATKIYIGCIDTKLNPQKTFTLKGIPQNTAEIKLTKSSIVYWTEWA